MGQRRHRERGEEMIIRADLHLHSKFSRATSESMDLEYISIGAKLKGLNLLGTGDFTHPRWFEELKGKLKEVGDGIYTYGGVNWMLTCEVSLIYPQDGKSRRVHHILLAPSFEVVEQINDALSHYGDLFSDGRPTFTDLTSPELVELMNSIDDDIFVIPSHAWTTWYGVFGANTGFDSLEACFKDKTDKIFAIETGLSCYDEKTEVLTDKGWKKIADVEYSDRVCTLNPRTHVIEFQVPVGKFVYEYKGKMFHQKGKSVDLLVTPNHKMWVKRRREKEFEFVEAKDLPEDIEYKADGKWKGRKREWFISPSVYRNRHCDKMKEKGILMNDWLEFLGYFLSAGNLSSSNRTYRITISQNQDRVRERIESCIRRIGFHCFQDQGNVTVVSKRLFEHLKEFKKDKQRFIPREILELPSKQLGILFRALMDGGGSLSEGWTYSTSSKRLADDFQELLLKVGFSGTVSSSQDGQYVISVNKGSITPFPNSKRNCDRRDWEDYEGVVYCLEVPNHVMYVRRNGKVCWCGNSDPPMNWRVSALDKVALVSNSDSHSPVPSRLGREFNVFDLQKLSYKDIFGAIKDRDGKRFLYTVEVPPEYGKYHYTGHRDCGISLHPRDAMKIKNICPVCKRKLTVGVLQRVEELADRPDGYVPRNAIPYRVALPLYEVISYLRGSGMIYSRKVGEEEIRYIKKAGDEISILLDLQEPILSQVVGEEISSIIRELRNGTMEFEPGYDGVYGKPLLKRSGQKNLTF
ncbi:MAG: LAGLIDADG family homing endonuclease [Nitrososphaeria archaeon]